MSTPRRPIIAALIATDALLGGGAASAQADYTATTQGTVLVIAGTSATEKVTVASDTTNYLIDNGQDDTADQMIPAAGITAVRVETRGGDDNVRFLIVPALLTGRTIHVVGGDGNDTISGSFAGDTASITVSLRVSERAHGLKRAIAFKAKTRTIAPGKTTTFKLKTPSTLLRALRKLKHPVRKPTITVTNTATGGKTTLKRTIGVR